MSDRTKSCPSHRRISKICHCGCSIVPINGSYQCVRCAAISHRKSRGLPPTFDGADSHGGRHAANMGTDRA